MISIALLITQIYLLAFFAMLLHFLSSRLGLLPLLIYTAAMSAIFYFAEILSFELLPYVGVTVRPFAHGFIPVILLIVLMIYIGQGTRSAQFVLFGLVTVNICALFLIAFMQLYIHVRSPDTVLATNLQDTTPMTWFFLRIYIASFIAFIADMYVIVVSYQWLRNTLPRLPRWIAPSVALLLALWTDSIIFNTVLHFPRLSLDFILANDLNVKILTSIAIAPLVGYYIAYLMPKMPHYTGAGSRPVFDMMSGTIQHINKTLHDLQSELSVSRSTYTQLTENIGEIFWLVDVIQNEVIYISPAFQTITGYDPETYYHQSSQMLNLIHPDDRIADVDSLLQFILQTENKKIRIIRVDGATRWIRTRVFPIIDEQGHPYRYAGITEDVTQAHLASERALALTIAEERVRVVHEFIRDASHDLKTPLSAILLKADMLNRPELDAQKRKRIRADLKTSAQHLSALIDDLFTLSKIESQNAPILEQLNLHQIIRAIVDNTRSLADAKGLEFETDLAAERTMIDGDKEQITRVVSNLIANAIRYTEQGKITVKTRIADDKIQVQVMDTGIGIDTDELVHIFERFYRSNQARAVNHQGTGLGLAISQAIVEKHQGELLVESEYGRGSTFSLLLPLAP